MLGDPHILQISAGARWATVLQLLDLDANLRLLATQTPIWGADLGLRLHPLFLMLFHESAWVDALAALNLRLALGAQANRDGLRAIWSWGASVDLPLGDPDSGASWWIGAEFGDNRGGSSVQTLERGDVSTLSLTLEYRINGL